MSPQTQVVLVKNLIIILVIAVIMVPLTIFVLSPLAHSATNAVSNSATARIKADSATISRVCGPHALSVFQAEMKAEQPQLSLIINHDMNVVMQSPSCK
jgi:hypothetical protein